MKLLKKNGFVPFLLLSVFLIVILALMARSMESVALYTKNYTWLVIAGVVLFLLLLFQILYYLLQLVSSVRKRRVGSRLNARMMLFFSGLSIIPIVLFFVFSSALLTRSIDSWFDESLDKGFDDALALAQSALETRRLDALQITQYVGNRVAYLSYLDLAYQIESLRSEVNAMDIAVFDQHGRYLAASSKDINQILPERPDNVILISVMQGMDYVWLEPLVNGDMRVRVIIKVGQDNPRIIQAFYEIPQYYTTLGESTQESVEKYKQYKALRGPLKDNMLFLLSMVTFLSILLALGGSFFASRRLVNPITRLSLATKSISEGRFHRTIRVKSNDEIGFLTHSFNEMVLKLRESHDAEKSSQRLLEAQRAYLATILSNLSSGVLVISNRGYIRTFNEAALSILSVGSEALQAIHVYEQKAIPEGLSSFIETLVQLISKVDTKENQRTEITRNVNGMLQILTIRVSEQRDSEGVLIGFIVVFDDITQLINSEREAAWGEVARRLAHEIKNPLTPIQLSAERMQLKLAGKLDEKSEALVEKSTKTIITQVNAMKEMVNAFSQYARAPKLNLKQLEMNQFVEDVFYLYEDSLAKISTKLIKYPTPLYTIGDEIRLRQLLHNLLKNSVEALEESGATDGEVIVSLDQIDDKTLALSVADNGIGISQETAEKMFEPYVSSKTKGTGLGLAVVKKIVEEHNGSIAIHSGGEKRGTTVEVHLPLHY